MKILLKGKKIAIFLTATVLFFSACQNNGKEKSNTQQAQKSETKTTGKQSKRVQNVIFTDENGNELSLNSLEGKVVFINFWATWCPPCREEMPSINTLKKSYKGNDDIVFLMVDIDRNLEKSIKFMKDQNLDFSVFEPTGEIPSSFLGNAIPTTVILNKKGEMVARIEGANDYSSPKVKKALDDLVAEN